MPKPTYPTFKAPPHAQDKAREQLQAQGQAQALESIDPTALANVSGGARRAPSSGGGGGGGGGGSDSDALIGALTGILDSLSSLANQQPRGFNAQEMMVFMMMMQQRNNAVQVVQPATPVIYSNGTHRVF
jgi:hypothetical protein